mgnify:CR=1 FL=1
MVCKNCNHEIDNGAMFCTYCGTPVDQTPEPETQPVENASTEDAAQNPYENVHSLRFIPRSRLPTVSHSRIRILSSTVSQIKLIISNHSLTKLHTVSSLQTHRTMITVQIKASTAINIKATTTAIISSTTRSISRHTTHSLYRPLHRHTVLRILSL